MRSLSGPLPDPAADAGWPDAPARKGFFTDTSICIGCKACEVACKEWNGVPEDGLNLLGSSYDNTGALGASTWRHVAFIEQPAVQAPAAPTPAPTTVALGMPTVGLPGEALDADTRTEFRWLMSSDVCKHCTHAACLDVCPTGALFRTEFGTVVVQDDICNGCGYCVPACPFGVIDRRIGEQGTKNVGIAQKCTLCYDRLGDGLTPACAQACPTESIQFGDLDELRERAAARVSSPAGARGDRGPAVRREPGRRRRRGRGDVPAARRARGVRPAAGSGGVHPGPAADVAAGRPGRARPARGRRGRFAGGR